MCKRLVVKKVVITDITNKNFEPSVACIGYFDGVHIGHARLLKKAISDAKKLKIKSSVICFEPDPINLITGKKNKHLTSYNMRLAIFDDYGIDIVYVIKFNEKFMKHTASSFISRYLNKMNLRELVCGFDYSFGYKAKGTPKLLLEKGNFDTVVISETKYKGEKVSSTRIKEAFIRGDFSLVNKLLGYNYLVDLKVIKCSKQAKKWLIEAKLSDNNCLLPNIDTYSENIAFKRNKVLILGKNKLTIGSHLYLTFDE